MALKSMTGYGRAEASDDLRSLTVELKSVNNRFLDFQCRLPRELAHLESVLRRELGNFVVRGSVTCHIHTELHAAPEGAAGLVLNEPLFRDYAALARRMAAEIGPSARVDVTDLLKLPDLLQQGGAALESPEAAAERVLPVFRLACADLAATREREGRDLARELESRARAFYPGLERVRTLLPQRQAEFTARLRERVRELLDGQAPPEDRILTEIGVMAERMDVAEEVVRLHAHLDHFLETLEAHAAPGKKLGFLLQEMLREVNTLGNKAQYQEISQITLGWKEELEIIREQLMNVE